METEEENKEDEIRKRQNSPTTRSSTPSPTLSTIPAASCPKTQSLSTINGPIRPVFQKWISELYKSSHQHFFAPSVPISEHIQPLQHHLALPIFPKQINRYGQIKVEKEEEEMRNSPTDTSALDMQQHLSMPWLLNRRFCHLDLVVRRHLQRRIALVCSHGCVDVPSVLVDACS